MRVVAVLPMGPTCDPDFVVDTIESIRHYCVATIRIIVVADNAPRSAEVAARTDVEVVATPGRGKLGGLYLNLSDGFRAALQQPFDLLLRIDSDALVAAAGWEQAAEQAFAADPAVAVLGPYRISYDGLSRDFTGPGHNLLRGVVRTRNLTALRLLMRARRNGYQPGESVLGGVCVYSPAAVRALNDAGLLGRPDLAKLGIDEDQLFGLLLRSLGFTFADFGNKFDDLPTGARWLGLPDHPETLIRSGKALIHSTKSHGDMDQATIRRYFAEARAAGSGLNQDAVVEVAGADGQG